MPSLVPFDPIFSRYGHETFIPPPPEWVDAMVLSSGGGAETYTVPSGAGFLVFTADANFYARINGTAAVPSTEVADGTGSVLNPAGFYVGSKFPSGNSDLPGHTAVTTIGFITAATNCIITIAVYE